MRDAEDIIMMLETLHRLVVIGEKFKVDVSSFEVMILVLEWVMNVEEK
jgi:hypothetical protein